MSASSGGGRQGARDGGRKGARDGGRAGPAPRRNGPPGAAAGKGSPRRGPAPADPARRIALDVVRAVSERDAYANLTLPAALSEAQEQGLLDERDAAFATELTYGTLRAQGTYDAVLAACVDRPLGRIDPPVLDVLRIGAHQVLGMRVPAHAAVGATVDLARAGLGRSGQAAAGFVNAVLRKVAAGDLPSWHDRLAPAYAEDPVGHLALVHAHPRWIVETLADALDGDMAETTAALKADNAPAAVTLAVRPDRGRLQELLDAGAHRGRWSPYAAVLEHGNPGALPAVRRGRAGVQDEGSQLVALALAGAPLEGRDERWLDLCAGPGGKTAMLGGVLAQRCPTGTLIGNELQPHRAALVAAATGGAPVTVVVGNGTRPAWAAGTFDRVLVDAPCTGLGALRRRPEARWRRRAEEVSELGPLQRALLQSALDSVRAGGVVAYATCSPHRAETRDVVSAVLARRVDVEQLDVRAQLPADMPQLGLGPDVQLWPHRHGTDAMYLALLRRIG